MARYSCGCENEEVCRGVSRCVSKCTYHASRAGRGGREYYETLGVGVDHYKEMAEAVGGLPRGKGLALEVGCGTSMYVDAVREAGYEYTAIEPDTWAAWWTSDKYNAPVTVTRYEDTHIPPECYSLLLCAHALEHMKEAVVVLSKFLYTLKPGGHLRLVVPDDEDPVNPDHLWFFTEVGLTQLLKDFGFVDVRSATRRIVPHEMFMYFAARRP